MLLLKYLKIMLHTKVNPGMFSRIPFVNYVIKQLSGLYVERIFKIP
jgi:hypothetical protein